MAETSPAAAFEQAVDDFEALLQRLTPQQWALTGRNAPRVEVGEPENRPVGHIAWHTAFALRRQLRFLTAAAHGRPAEATSMAELDELNARQAEAHPQPDRDAVLQTLRSDARPLAEALRRLTPEQLELGARIFDRDWTLGSFVRHVVVGHLRWHQASIEATIGEGGPA